jgi:hypothetical protein
LLLTHPLASIFLSRSDIQNPDPTVSCELGFAGYLLPPANHHLYAFLADFPIFFTFDALNRPGINLLKGKFTQLGTAKDGKKLECSNS